MQGIRLQEVITFIVSISIIIYLWMQ